MFVEIANRGKKTPALDRNAAANGIGQHIGLFHAGRSVVAKREHQISGEIRIDVRTQRNLGLAEGEAAGNETRVVAEREAADGLRIGIARARRVETIEHDAKRGIERARRCGHRYNRRVSGLRRQLRGDVNRCNGGLRRLRLLYRRRGDNPGGWARICTSSRCFGGPGVGLSLGEPCLEAADFRFVVVAHGADLAPYSSEGIGGKGRRAYTGQDG